MSSGSDFSDNSPPWTIFDFPSALTDSNGLPQDGEAKRYFFELRGLGLDVTLWKLPESPDTSYFAVAYADREFADSCILKLETTGRFEPGFGTRHTNFLFGDAPES